MKKATLLVSVILAPALTAMLLSGCKSQDSLIERNTKIAKVQLSMLADSASAGGTLRIPSSFKDGRIVYVPTDDWVSGFFAGTLWYMYELTGDEYWAAQAEKHTVLLEEIQHLKWHHDVGFMVYDSYGNGLRLKGKEAYKDVILTTAASLATRFREGAGILQSWNTDRGWQAERGWKCPVIIDNMMNLELLFKATEFSGDSTYFRIAVSHADKTMENHFRPDNSCYHVVDYDPETGEVRRRCTAQGYSDESAWARGQAWAVYGYTTAFGYTGFPRYLEQAEKVAAYILDNPALPEDKVPYWDFNDPAIPDTYRDASSAAIIASALYRLHGITGKEAYLAAADKMLESLSSPAYMAEKGTNGGFLLMHSVGSIPHGSSIDVPLNYADYYFLEAMLRKRSLQ